MEIPALVRSLKSSTLSSTSYQMNETFWGAVSAAVEKSRRKANMVTPGAEADPKFPPTQNNKPGHNSNQLGPSF